MDMRMIFVVVGVVDHDDFIRSSYFPSSDDDDGWHLDMRMCVDGTSNNIIIISAVEEQHLCTETERRSVVFVGFAKSPGDLHYFFGKRIASK